MDNLNNNNQPQNQGRVGVVNGQEGTWVPVSGANLPFSVSQDPNNPSVAPDGNMYYAEGGNMSNGGFGSIAANYNNAIPTPSQIVQLPPIVQPIALVPYASQNQPMLQYNPNERPHVETTTQEPIYRAKPYAGLSTLLILLAVVACIIVCLIKTIVCGASVSGLDSIFGVLTVAGVGTFDSLYYTNALKTLFAGGLSDGFGNMPEGLYTFLIPVFYAITLVLGVIIIIYYLAKLGKRKSPRGFNWLTFIGLILSVANVVIMFLSDKVDPDIGAYVIAGLYLVMLIVPFFAKKNAQVLDYAASKRTYIQ